MKNLLILLLIAILFIGCRITQKTETIIYKPTESSKAFSIEVPQNYKMILIEGNSYSYYFYYDTTFIFISNESGFWNEKIDKNKISDSLRFYAEASEYGTIPSIDTFYSHGISNHLNWKEQFIYYKYPPFLQTDTIWKSDQKLYRHLNNPNSFQCLYIGYGNVPKRYLSFFNYCLSTLKIIPQPDFKLDPIIQQFHDNQREKDQY